MKTFEKPLNFITQVGHYFLPKSETARRAQLITALIILVGLVVTLLIVL